MRIAAPVALAVVLAVPAGAGDVLPFAAGGAAGFAAHEGGHLLANALLDGRPRVKRVEFLGVPFFAISPTAPLTPRRRFVISAAGFWVQGATSEWALARRGGLRPAHAPFAKGVLTFDVATSLGYAAAAIGGVGPLERDTRGMAGAARMKEAWIGVLVLAPAALDAWRYHHPRDGWATWTSRASKVALVALVARARNERR